MSNRLTYRWEDEMSVDDHNRECDSVSWIKVAPSIYSCIVIIPMLFLFQVSDTSNSDVSRTLSFAIPADPIRFTNSNETILHLSAKVVNADGSSLSESDEVFISVDNATGFFTSSQVQLGNLLLPSFELCPNGSKLMNRFGSAAETRRQIWDPLSGYTYLENIYSSKVDASLTGCFVMKIKQCQHSKLLNLYARFPSPFMQSVTQLLPPGVPLTLSLRRASDAFVLSTLESSRDKSYKLSITNACVYVRRILLASVTNQSLKQSLSLPNWGLKYVRLSSQITMIPKGTQVFSGANLLTDYSRRLPQICYIYLVSESAFFGSYDRLSTYWETADAQKIQLFNNGRNLLSQSIKTHFVYNEDDSLNIEKADAIQPFLVAMCSLGHAFAPQKPVPITYTNFVCGAFCYVSKLSGCDESGPINGTISVELTFARPLLESTMLIICGEYETTIKSLGNNDFQLEC